MSVLTTRSSNPAIREVSRGLSEAGDEQILQVVAMVDAMPGRGAADQVIAPLREGWPGCGRRGRCALPGCCSCRSIR